MISIHKRLTAMILGTLFFCLLTIAVFNFFYVHEEASEILDGELRQLAISVAPFQYGSQSYEKDDAEHLAEESDFLIQVWQGRQIVYSSHPNIAVPLLDPGYGHFGWKGEELRYFHYNYQDRAVQVALSLSEREESEYDVFRNTMLTIVLMFPISVLLVRWVVGHGLRPLVTLSHSVEERDARNLNPIDINDAPDEVLPVIQSLNQLLGRLEASLTLQRQFTADAAHELRTPLSAIKLNLDMLQRADTEEERKGVEQGLTASVSRAIHLVQSLLLLARHETDALAVEMEAVDVVSITKQVVANLSAFAADKEQRVNLNFATDSEIIIAAQEHNIFVLIENLLHNAILYTPQKGNIEMGAEVGTSGVVFTIQDDGPGIEPADRLRVFDRFYRGLGTKQQGSGLGLSIVRNIVGYYQGSIVIEDGTNGKGCKFVITFPITPTSK